LGLLAEQAIDGTLIKSGLLQLLLRFPDLLLTSLLLAMTLHPTT